jgi:hypothetical protein
VGSELPKIKSKLQVVALRYQMTIPKTPLVREGVLRAVERLAQQDGTLFEMPVEKNAPYDARKLHEVCINHKLAEHLAIEIIPLLDDSEKMFVDIEFNREGVNFKNVVINGRIERVRPDIIIHNRKSGTRRFNFLVAECKKSDASHQEIRHDRAKITALMTDPRYKYHFGLQIIYGRSVIRGTFYYKQDSLIKTSDVKYLQPKPGSRLVCIR